MPHTHIINILLREFLFINNNIFEDRCFVFYEPYFIIFVILLATRMLINFFKIFGNKIRRNKINYIFII